MFETFLQVIFYTVITTQDHGTYQSKHFFGPCRQGTIHVGIGVKVKDPFNHLVILRKQFFVHFLPVRPEGINHFSPHSMFGLRLI
jgi:hypothetical protein